MHTAKMKKDEDDDGVMMLVIEVLKIILMKLQGFPSHFNNIFIACEVFFNSCQMVYFFFFLAQQPLLVKACLYHLWGWLSMTFGLPPIAG